MAIPTMSDTMMVRGSSTRPLDGMSTPNWLSSASRSLAVSTPSAMPSSDATNPMMTDSMSSEPRICPRLAPMARSSAFSFCRWATMIEKVL